MHIKNYREIRARLNELIYSLNEPLNNRKNKASKETRTVTGKIFSKIQELEELSSQLEDSILENGC